MPACSSVTTGYQRIDGRVAENQTREGEPTPGHSAAIYCTVIALLVTSLFQLLASCKRNS